MKKIVLIVICIAISFLILVSCGKNDAQTSDPVGGTTESMRSMDNCEHEWALTAFITEDTDISFAGEFTCDKCAKKETRSLTYTDIEIPLVSLTGDVSPFRSESGRYDQSVKVPAEFSYKSAEMSLDCAATLKLQGKSTASDDKCNFSVNLLDAESGDKKKVAFQQSWGEGYKYVLKSNYCDPSGVRNITCATLYGQMAHGLNLADHYTYLVNCGAVDGYPVLVYLNGQYQGLYNWVIRKDKWLYGMGDENAGEAVLEGSDMSVFESEEGLVILPEGMASAKSWEEEYVNDNYGPSGWAEASFNEMLFAIRNADNAHLREVIAEYVELDRTLDVMLFNSVFGTADNVCGNQVWCTFDGKKWAPVVYDHDRALGRSGNCLIDSQEDIAELIEQNLLYDKIINAYYLEVSARYNALRKSVFTVENVMNIIHEKQRGLDEKYFAAELEKWQDATWRDNDESDQITGFDAENRIIKTYLEERFAYCDIYFASVAAA